MAISETDGRDWYLVELFKVSGKATFKKVAANSQLEAEQYALARINDDKVEFVPQTSNFIAQGHKLKLPPEEVKYSGTGGL